MPQLILTADPGFSHLALDEFSRDAHNGRPLDELAPGICLVDCDEGYWGLAETWIDSPPVFARHICPVDLTVPLIAKPRDLSRLSDAAVAEYADLLDPDVSFSVQSRILADFHTNRSTSTAPLPRLSPRRKIPTGRAAAISNPLCRFRWVGSSEDKLRKPRYAAGRGHARASGLHRSLHLPRHNIFGLGRRRTSLPP